MNPQIEKIKNKSHASDLDSVSEIDREFQREEEGQHESNWKDARKGSDWRKKESVSSTPTLEDGAD
jgi:hypothetical protein